MQLRLDQESNPRPADRKYDAQPFMANTPPIHVSLIIIRPHPASQYYVRRCGLLLQTKQRGLSVTLSPAKTAEPIEMPFGLRTRVSRRNHVLDGSPDRPMRRDNL